MIRTILALLLAFYPSLSVKAALASIPSQYVSPMKNTGSCSSICLDGGAHGNSSSTSSGTTLAVTINSVHSGDLVTCQAIYESSSTLTHIADTLNGTFTNDNGPTAQAFEQEDLVMSSFPNSAAGNDTITLTVSPASAYTSISCQAWKTVIHTSPVDGTAAAKCGVVACSSGTSSLVSNATTNTATLGSASTDLEIAVVAFGSQTATAGSCCTLIDVDATNAMYPEYVINSVPTSAEWVNSADNWITMMTTYKHQ